MLDGDSQLQHSGAQFDHMSSAGSKTKLGYAHYVCFPDDGRRHEIINGDHYVNPAPSTYHQTVSRRIQYQLYTQLELRDLGVVYNAPVDVQLSDHDIVQPDLVVVLHSKRTIITPTKIKGIPNLLVEILSPSSEGNDRTLKRDLYQRVGVPEYWIVDPFDHVLQQLVLRGAEYELQPATEDVRLSIVDGVVVPLQQVW